MCGCVNSLLIIPHCLQVGTAAARPKVLNCFSEFFFNLQSPFFVRLSCGVSATVSYEFRTRKEGGRATYVYACVLREVPLTPLSRETPVGSGSCCCLLTVLSVCNKVPDKTCIVGPSCWRVSSWYVSGCFFVWQCHKHIACFPSMRAKAPPPSTICKV